MTNFGINNKKDLCKITIDKICGVWYNGNFGAGERQRPEPFSYLEKKEGVAPLNFQVCIHPKFLLLYRPVDLQDCPFRFQ